MFKLNLTAIPALAIKVSFRLLAVASVITFASSAAAEPGIYTPRIQLQARLWSLQRMAPPRPLPLA